MNSNEVAEVLASVMAQIANKKLPADMAMAGAVNCFVKAFSNDPSFDSTAFVEIVNRPVFG